ncbi:MAG: aldehyde ferredoxin oxidoreductase family protein [Thermoplasmata archaeon]
MNGGYHFRYLDIDLEHGAASISVPDKALLRKFIGGKGLGLALLCELDRSRHPLDPENPLIFLTGPLTGTTITTSNRSCAVTRSPLTGGFLDSHAGGHFGTAIKGAGYDYIIIRGKADIPVYLKVNPEGVELEDASDLWGMGCYETEDVLKKEHPDSHVASIGPAGENLVKFACISTEKYRQFGRGGAGAVMGSKNLKALVVEGRERLEIHDPEKYRQLALQMTKETVAHPNRKKRYELGTPMWIRMGQEIGGFLPTHNFKYGTWKDYESLTSETMKDELKWESCGCYNCVIQCSKRVTYDGGDFEGPEYETAAYLGSGCELADARALAAANSLCDDLGLDSISCGVTISFAMEAAEKGLLSPEDCKWIKFGSADAVLELVNRIAHRQGIGDVLAEGTRLASRKIGKGSEYFAIQVGGMELSGVNPLGCYSMALALTTSDFASHTRLWTATDEMMGNLELEKLIPYIATGQDDVNVRNSLIVCDFLMFGLDRLAPMMEAATGYPYTKDELLKVGERIHHLARLYNLRTGRTHADDVLPARFHEEESCSGLMKGQKIPREMFERHVQEYFKYRGWDAEGRPTIGTQEKNGLGGF